MVQSIEPVFVCIGLVGMSSGEAVSKSSGKRRENGSTEKNNVGPGSHPL